jgi:hypothetical protein
VIAKIRSRFTQNEPRSCIEMAGHPGYPKGNHMPLVHECDLEGCDVLTMSLYCLEHERATDRCVNAALLDAASSAADGARETDEP